MKSGSFRNTQWDPILLISQIISVQFCVYFTLGLSVGLANMLAGDNYRLDNIFEYHEIHVSDLGGRLLICAFVTNSFLASLALWCIVRRAKLCLDFSCTFHIFHLLICWWYNNAFPSNISWWLLNCITATIMCIGGEFLCLKSELKEIPVGYSALNQKSDV
ncbi:protein SYS1 homolog [Calliphora vicina]|uniref:protein SYS1 homolog n=1 Tax=Calliphora vicina TaxID=7373 RepID=UPI00325A8838